MSGPSPETDNDFISEQAAKQTITLVSVVETTILPIRLIKSVKILPSWTSGKGWMHHMERKVSHKNLSPNNKRHFTMRKRKMRRVCNQCMFGHKNKKLKVSNTDIVFVLSIVCCSSSSISFLLQSQ
jgi:hypothetical protein